MDKGSKRSRSEEDEHDEAVGTESDDSDASFSERESEETSSSGDETASTSSSSEKKKKKKRKKKRKKEKKRKKDKKDKKDKKRKKEKKHKSSKHKSKKHKRDDDDKQDDGPKEFGHYGILKPTEMKTSRHRRGFEAWIGEVKKMENFNGPQWELKELWGEFSEDFNTCTLPHEKFYNYDKWEAEEYSRQKQKADASGKSVSDERRHQEEMRRAAEEKRLKELHDTVASMSKDKIEGMREQAVLRTTMADAHKRGDLGEVARIKRLLEPPDPRR